MRNERPNWPRRRSGATGAAFDMGPRPGQLVPALVVADRQSDFGRHHTHTRLSTASTGTSSAAAQAE